MVLIKASPVDGSSCFNVSKASNAQVTSSQPIEWAIKWISCRVKSTTLGVFSSRIWFTVGKEGMKTKILKTGTIRIHSLHSRPSTSQKWRKNCGKSQFKKMYSSLVENSYSFRAQNFKKHTKHVWRILFCNNQHSKVELMKLAHLQVETQISPRHRKANTFKSLLEKDGEIPLPIKKKYTYIHIHIYICICILIYIYIKDTDVHPLWHVHFFFEIFLGWSVPSSRLFASFEETLPSLERTHPADLAHRRRKGCVLKTKAQQVNKFGKYLGKLL